MSRTNTLVLAVPALTVVLTSLALRQPGIPSNPQVDENVSTISPIANSPGPERMTAPVKMIPATVIEEVPLSPPKSEPQAGQTLSVLLAQAGIEAQPKSEPLAENATRLPIIEYHYSTFYFDGVMMKPEWFVEQMEWLSEQGFHTLTIDELADFVDGSSAPPQPAVALTFDVGISHFDDYTEVVVSTLRRLGLHGIFFIQTQGVLEECDGKFTCWESLAEWLEEGVISVGSHTVYHQDFTTLSSAQILVELKRSKEVIEEKLGVSIIGVCYPFDAVNPDAFPILERLGYRFAVGGWTRSDRSAHLGDPEPYSLPRLYPYSNDSIYPAMAGSGGLSFAELMTAATDSLP